MYRAVAISRQLASRGRTIARRVAEELGWELAAHDRMEALAQEYGIFPAEFAEIDEKAPPRFVRWLMDTSWRETTRGLFAQMVNELASRGNVVILGRGGAQILRDRRDVLRVRIVAPDWVRIRRLQMDEGLTGEQADQVIRESDTTRKEFVEFVAGCDWDDDRIYDLVVNTGAIHPETAVRLIVTAVREGIPQDH